MLKSLLSLLLSLFYSKSESAKVASQSLPNELDFTSVTLNTSQPDTFAAPYDGYLCIVVDTGGSINVWGDGLQSSNYSLNNGQSKLFVPMRKGNIIGYSISGRLLFGKFYRLVGGGYSAIEKLIRSGGALCLSNLYNSLRRSSLLTKRNGSEVKVFSQTQIPEQRSLLTTLRLSFIRLQVMDGLHSAETGHRSMSALPESWEHVALTLKVISELQLRFGRGIPLVSIARQTISNRLRQNSFPAKGQRNTSLVGGASC